MSDRPLVVALDDYEHALRRLADWSAIEARAELRVHHAPLHGDELLRAIESADALLLMRDRTPLPAALIGRLPKLRLVVYTGTRNAALDVAALARRGIAVCHTEWGPSKESTCELAWTLILAAAKRLPQAVQGLREGRWRADGEPDGASAQRQDGRDGSGATLGAVLHGERLGLVGLGEIGGRMARVGRAFGMDVVAWSPRMTPERAAAQGATAVTLDELVATSKVVSRSSSTLPAPGSPTKPRWQRPCAPAGRARPPSTCMRTSRSTATIRCARCRTRCSRRTWASCRSRCSSASTGMRPRRSTRGCAAGRCRGNWADESGRCCVSRRRWSPHAAAHAWRPIAFAASHCSSIINIHTISP
jgi:hypothetical protein